LPEPDGVLATKDLQEFLQVQRFHQGPKVIFDLHRFIKFDKQLQPILLQNSPFRQMIHCLVILILIHVFFPAPDRRALQASGADECQFITLENISVWEGRLLFSETFGHH